LLEELGISAQLTSGPLAAAHVRELIIPGLVHDAEFVESYRLDGWDRPVAHNDEEVCEVKWLDLGALKQDMQANPGSYTEWLTDEIASLDWFGI
jgi:isopentenyldiphosphate isomerase